MQDNKGEEQNTEGSGENTLAPLVDSVRVGRSLGWGAWEYFW